LQVVLDVIDLLADEHPFLEAQPAHLGSERREAIAGKDNELERFAGPDAGGSFKQQIDAFQRTKIRGVEEHHLLTKTELAADLLPRAPRRARVEKVVDDLDGPLD